MKKKEIKLIIFISLLILTFIIYLFFKFKAYDYEKTYIINEYKIVEKYNKENSYYTFYITTKNQKFPYIIKSKYLKKRELIKNINIYNKDLENCILPESENLKFYPLCYDKDSLYSYYISNINDIYNYENIKEVEKEYNKTTIYNIRNLSFLLYNYKGFYLINENENKEIKLFNKDIYSINLIYQKDNYLIIPDYNQNYYFDKIFIINIKNGKIKEIKFDYDISFESVFLGEYKDSVFLLDKKEEKEYKIDLKKERIEKIDFQILKENKLIKTEFKDIIKNNLNFLNKNFINYEIIDEKLFFVLDDIKIKITNKKIDKIIKNDDETIYYLSDEKLYMYNNMYGEILLLSNFEWNFNNTNMIFIF